MVCSVLDLFPLMFHCGNTSILQIFWTFVARLDDFLQVKTEDECVQHY